ncbi:MAG: hypothetical protein PWQ55_2639 [Chloroflexota bacterium]|nr:hypothetical protein [Chloroflexota bacterium]
MRHPKGVLRDSSIGVTRQLPTSYFGLLAVTLTLIIKAGFD